VGSDRQGDPDDPENAARSSNQRALVHIAQRADSCERKTRVHSPDRFADLFEEPIIALEPRAFNDRALIEP
jgi:hypothetical protein